MDADEAARRAILTRSKANYLRSLFCDSDHYEVSSLEIDERLPLDGSDDYEGNCLTFIVVDGHLEYRVLIEDVTIDG